MSTLHHGRHTFTCPGIWNELSFAQLRKIVMLEAQRLPVGEFLERAALVLFNIHWWNLKKRYVFSFLLSDEDQLDLQLFGQFLLDRGKLTINPQPIYRQHHGLHKWSQLELLEWVLAEGFYVNFTRSKDEDQLNKLVAVLYRPAGTGDPLSADATGDSRQPFNSNNVEARAKLISRWPLDVRLVALTFYEGIRSQVNAALPKGGKKQSRNSNYGQALMNMLHGLSDNDLTRLPAVAKMKLPVVISQLNKNLEDAAESERHHQARQ